MAYFLGKSGADAVYIALHTICKVLGRYRTKLNAAIDAALASAVITSEQAVIAHAFIDAADLTCDIFALVSGNSGF